MSGSGGFFKYRCKYFYTHDCPNWVFVNYAPCAECCAAGRDDPDSDDALPARQVLLFQLGAGAGAGAAPARPGLDIAVPVFRDGILHYARTHVAVHAVPGAPFVAWQFPESGGGGGGGSNGGGGHAVAPSPHQQLLHQHAAPPYGDHDYVDGNDGADNTHHYTMHGDRDDDHLHAQHQPRPSPPTAHHLHPHSPRWQQQHRQHQQPLHGDDEYNGLPPPYPGYLGSYAGLRY